MIGLARSTWNAPAASPPPPRRVWRDWAAVAALAVIAVLEGALRTDLSRPWLAVTVTVALLPTLLWRRTLPLRMLAIAVGTGAVATLLFGKDAQLNTTAYVLLLTYSVFRWGSGRATVVGFVIMLGTLGLSDIADRPTVAEAIGGLAVVLTTMTLGLSLRFRAGLRARELDRAKSFERERLARDLHDTVAHHVSAIAIQAQAGLATSHSRREAATEALRAIEAEASRTLAEMRSMVHVLRRDDAAEFAPGARIADLELLARPAGDGPAVEVRLHGEFDDLPPAVESAVYRLAQESVTNARRHAHHATRIEVFVDADTKRIRVTVQDDGDPGAAFTPGYGITGMIERAALLGGTCTAGRSAGRGFTVAAVLPRAGWAT
ncbi:MAG: histidine kinase [Actinomycetota bacterium]